MKEKLLERKFQLEQQVARIDAAIKFFEEHPEMEHLLNAITAMSGPVGLF